MSGLTDTKTRLGLILQGVVASALRSQGVTFRENWQYDPLCERPDFTIPDSDTPRIVIEVHQTEGYNSFLMKVMRAFNAVAEAKVHFGPQVVSANILFGRPRKDLPPATLRAMSSFFDFNLLLGDPVHSSLGIQALEAAALRHASARAVSVATACDTILDAHKDSIRMLGQLLVTSLAGSSPKHSLDEMWRHEIDRTARPRIPQSPDAVATHYKRAALDSLLISDALFAKVAERPGRRDYESAEAESLVRAGVAQIRKRLGNSTCVVLTDKFHSFASDTAGKAIRALCSRRLASSPETRWFFLDIQDDQRRGAMVDAFLDVASRGWIAFASALRHQLIAGEFSGIFHQRSWLFELLVLSCDVGLKEFGRRIFQDGRNAMRLQDPAGHLALRSARFRAGREASLEYVDDVVTVARALRSKAAAWPDKASLDARFLKYRLGAAIKLQKLNPLYVSLEEIALEHGWTAKYIAHQSLLSDLSGSSDPVGKYVAYSLRKGSAEVVANALYVADSYGSDHKADEWSARRRSLGYRMKDKVVPIERKAYILVVDGVWASKSIEKLAASGWTHICRLGQLGDVLRSLG